MAAQAPLNFSAPDPQVSGDRGGRDCERCGGPLQAHNRRGECVRCQRTCPLCGGPKSAVAALCRRCGRAPDAEPESVSLAGRALVDLPARIQELLDAVVTLARYARDLEDELEGQRAELRELRAGIAGALARRGA